MALAMTIGSTSASLGFPTNVEFVTHLYNTSNCSNTSSIRNISLNHFCYDTHIVNGHPNCCNELLNEVSLFENVSFGQCVGFNMSLLNRTLTNMTNMTNLTGIEYSCNIAHVSQFSTVEALSYIGLFSMCLLAVLFVGGIMYYMCSYKSRQYNRL
jgi:hypothetical protein